MSSFWASMACAPYLEQLHHFIKDTYPFMYAETSWGNLNAALFDTVGVKVFDVVNWDTTVTVYYVTMLMDILQSLGFSRDQALFVVQMYSAPCFCNALERYSSDSKWFGVPFVHMSTNPGLISGGWIHVVLSDILHPSFVMAYMSMKYKVSDIRGMWTLVNDMSGLTPPSTASYSALKFVTDDLCEFVYKDTRVYTGQDWLIKEEEDKAGSFTGKMPKGDQFVGIPINFLVNRLVVETDYEYNKAALQYTLAKRTYLSYNTPYIHELDEIFRQTVSDIYGVTLEEALGRYTESDIDNMSDIEIAQLLDPRRLRWQYDKEQVYEQMPSEMIKYSVDNQVNI
jgi:hypothetical protein